tara:strand:- start:658 stop:948 length:291 start_codon:yes stop_codon:yes gene_type:complete
MHKDLNVSKLKALIIEAGEVAVNHLINVAKEKIIKPDPEDELAADRLKNAAASKKLAVFDAFEILKRIEEEKAILDGTEQFMPNNISQGFAEKRSK